MRQTRTARFIFLCAGALTAAVVLFGLVRALLTS